MEKEFKSLSEKIMEGDNRFGWVHYTDVREFIKILLLADKEGLNMTEIIKYNAGDELI